MLAIARGLVERGDHVRFVTGSSFADQVAATGATYIPLPPEADFDLRFLDRFPEREKLKGVKAIAFDIEHVFVRPARRQFDTLMATHSALPADVILVEPC